ncbi:hypothetical protein MHZ95_00470 [Sporosarcina sp. ACRSM]|nr:hypothetical protein [Sporosarcina sp. ACRSM]MCG7333743.1 hypothetical protein [Sporosarcina sp. ACRSM]
MATESIVKISSDLNNHRVSKALNEVRLIQTAELPKKSARDFLKESREK